MSYDRRLFADLESGDGQHTVIVERQGVLRPYRVALQAGEGRGYEIVWGSGGDSPFTPLRSSAARANFLLDLPGLIAQARSIRDGGVREHRMSIETEGALDWRGYCMPDQVRAGANNRRQVVPIPAKDRLLSLDEPWLDADGNPYEGHIAASVLIADILDAAGLGYSSIEVVMDWRPQELGDSDHPLQVLIPAAPFYQTDAKGTVQAATKGEVLRVVLERFRLTATQWRAPGAAAPAWHLAQPEAFALAETVTVWTYDAAGAFVSSYSDAAYVDLTDNQWLEDSDDSPGRPALRAFKSTYAFGALDDELVANGSFEAWDILPGVQIGTVTLAQQGEAESITATLTAGLSKGQQFFVFEGSTVYTLRASQQMAPGTTLVFIERDFLKVSAGAKLYISPSFRAKGWRFWGNTSYFRRSTGADGKGYSQAIRQAFAPAGTSEGDYRKYASTYAFQTFATEVAAGKTDLALFFSHGAYAESLGERTVVGRMTGAVASGSVQVTSLQADVYQAISQYTRLYIVDGGRTYVAVASAPVAAGSGPISIYPADFREGITEGAVVRLTPPAHLSEIQAFYAVRLTDGADEYWWVDGAWKALADLADVYEKRQPCWNKSIISDEPLFHQERIHFLSFPITGHLTLLLYQGVAPETDDLAYVRYDDVALRLVSDDDAGITATSYGYADSANPSGAEESLTSPLGDGPYSGARGAMRLADGTPTSLWRVPGDPAAYPVAELHSRQHMRGHRRSQRGITLSLFDPRDDAGDPLALSPVRAIEYDGVRYWPVLLKRAQWGPLWELTGVELRDDGVPSGRTVLDEQRAAIFSGGSGAAVWTDLNQRISAGWQTKADAVVRETVPGLVSVTQIPIDPVDSIFKAGMRVYLTDLRTMQPFPIVIAKNYPKNGAALTIEEVTFPYAITPRSWITIDPRDLLALFILGENGFRFLARSGTLCEIAESVNAEVDEITVTPTLRDLAVGTDLDIGTIGGVFEDGADPDFDELVPPSERQDIPLQVRDDPDLCEGPEGARVLKAGATVIPIELQWVTARKGDYVVESHTQTNADLTIQPDKIQAAMEKRVAGTGWTTLSADVAAGSVSSLPVVAITTDADAGDVYVLEHKREGDTVPVYLTAGRTAGATSLAVDDGAGGPVVLAKTFPAGSRLRLSDRTVRGELKLIDGQISLIASDVSDVASATAALGLRVDTIGARAVLKAGYTAGAITSLAQLDLEAGTETSLATLEADTVNITAGGNTVTLDESGLSMERGIIQLAYALNGTALSNITTIDTQGVTVQAAPAGISASLDAGGLDAFSAELSQLLLGEGLSQITLDSPSGSLRVGGTAVSMEGHNHSGGDLYPDNLYTDVVSSGVTLSLLGQQINVGGLLTIYDNDGEIGVSLPASAPATAGRLWVDASGFVKVS